MKYSVRPTLPILVSLALASAPAWAEEDSDKPKPGLYTTVDEASIYIIQPDGSTTDVRTGEAVFVDPQGLQFVDRSAAFLDWPCGTGLAGGRGSLPTFTMDDLQPGNTIDQVVQRWFEDGQVLASRQRWLNGSFHARVPYAEIDAWVDPAVFWYRSGQATAKMAGLRPKTLIIAIFRGTGQVVVDTNHLDELRAEFGDEEIPVFFEYFDENIVPISYFGVNPSAGQLLQAYTERGVKAAEVPMQFGGDYHLGLAAGDVASTIGAPALTDISPERRAVLERELAAVGFRAKAVNLSILAGSANIVADEAEKIRVAEAMGLKTLPVQFLFFSETSLASHCGVAPPVAAVGALGLLDPAGEIPPDPIAVPPESPPAEVELPNPPQPELPEPVDPDPPTSPN